jgi:hypothetical protein
MADQFNNWDAIADALMDGSKESVKKTAGQTRDAIRAHIISNGQVDTGFMRDSVYIVTRDENTYEGGKMALPSVERPGSDLEAYYAVAASYGEIQDKGSVHLPARPFWDPAIDDMQDNLDDAMISIVRKMESAS